mmetsp:Transcript_18016/g.37498  ORF Transcript_18016/g.37498 Transcript_18016/m.37498 type:complete len:226 (+) Transcript_18016:103-780(+)
MSLMTNDKPSHHLGKGDAKDGSVSPGLSEGLSSGSLSDHVSKDGKHGSTAVVELDVELAGLDLLVNDVLSEPSDAVVSVVLGSRHPGELNESKKGEDLGKSSRRDLGEASEDLSANAGSVNVGELEVLGLGDVSVEDDAVGVDNLSDKGSHANTSVLALDGTAALESLRLRVEPSKRIVDTEGLSDTELKLVDLEGGGGLGRRGRGKSSSRGNKGSEKSELHGCL